jgi:hypothetical protein
VSWDLVSDIGEVVVALATCAAAIAAWVAARAAREGVDATRRASEALLLLEALREYNGAEMGEALTRLSGWGRSVRDQGERTIVEEWRLTTAGKDSLNAARRRVTSYFSNLDELREAGLISERTWRTATDKAGLGVLFDVCAPLEPEVNRNARMEFVNRLRRAFGNRTMF